MGPGDLGALIALIGVISGVAVLAGAFAGAYFFGKSKGLERISEGQRFTTRLLSEKKAFEP